jgi:DNA polymerase-3 subunit epsilon
VDNWPRVVQLGWMLFSERGSMVMQREWIIKPEGYVIPEEATAVHGITNEQAKQGAELQEVLCELSNHIATADTVVCHNAAFDLPIIQAEFYRAFLFGCDMFANLKQVCTMRTATPLCKLPGPYGYKWPKLTELHQYLFGCGYDGEHSALSDARATARCYWEMKRRGVV